MRIAITREVSPAIVRCQLSHLARRPIDVARARNQHRDYEDRLRRLGCRVEHLPAAPDLPDSVFVEDVAVVLDEVAILTRPGALSRRAEIDDVAGVLAQHRTLARIEAPATLDGGDVLRVGRTLYVGRSQRTNGDGILQLEAAVAAHGYQVRPVPFDGCLHLKSAATTIGANLLLIQPRWVSCDRFEDSIECIEVDATEPFAANALWVGDRVLCAASSPRTQRKLAARGLAIECIDASELAKAEGGLTCCSVIFDA